MTNEINKKQSSSYQIVSPRSYNPLTWRTIHHMIIIRQNIKSKHQHKFWNGPDHFLYSNIRLVHILMQLWHFISYHNCFGINEMLAHLQQRWECFIHLCKTWSLVEMSFHPGIVWKCHLDILCIPIDHCVPQHDIQLAIIKFCNTIPRLGISNKLLTKLDIDELIIIRYQCNLKFNVPPSIEKNF